jgi:ABC-2 type transport system permease protein
MEVIYILWLRQMRRYTRSRARMIGALGQPVLYLVSLGYGLGQIYQRAGEGSYLQFLAPGIIGQSILFTSFFSGGEIIWDRQFGFLKETLVAPVPRFVVLLGRTLGGATVATLQGLIVLIIASLLGFRVNALANVPLAALAMALVSLLFTTLSTALASQVDDMQGFQLIINFIVMPCYFLSGALFPLSTAPGWLRAVAYLNPLTYGVDLLRGLLTGQAYFPILLDALVLGVATALLTALGSYLFSRLEA